MIPGMPMANILIYLTGVALVLAVVSIVTNKQKRLAMLLLAAYLLLIIVIVFMPGLSDDAMSETSMTMIMKDIGMIGGALMIAGSK